MTSLSRDLTRVETFIDSKIGEVVTSNHESKKMIEQKVEEVVEHVRAQPLAVQSSSNNFFGHLEGIQTERVTEAGGRLSLIDELKFMLASELNNS